MNIRLKRTSLVAALLLLTFTALDAPLVSHLHAQDGTVDPS